MKGNDAFSQFLAKSKNSDCCLFCVIVLRLQSLGNREDVMFDLLPCLPPQNLRYWGNWWWAHFTCTNIVGGLQKSNSHASILKESYYGLQTNRTEDKLYELLFCFDSPWTNRTETNRTDCFHLGCTHWFRVDKTCGRQIVRIAYPGYILGISRAYIGHILRIAWEYLGHILGISYLGHILGISLA